MLRLRPYKAEDAETIISWCRDEVSFRKWTADRYESFPITAEDMNRKYLDNNGDCDEADNFFPFTAFDENGIAGHLIMRYLDAEKSHIRFGFVIVDDSRRGQGYGRKMLSLALDYAFNIFKAKKVDLGVFENNPPAMKCYRAAGFKPCNERVMDLLGEKWKCIDMEIKREDYFCSKAIKGLHHVSMKCADLKLFEKALSFYKDILGFAEERRWDQGVMLKSGWEGESSFPARIEIFCNGEGVKALGAVRHFALCTDKVDELAAKVEEAGDEVFIKPKDNVVPSKPEFHARLAFFYGPLGEQVELFNPK
jgi:RimJ/RimL family protein N-acetyltransferase/catechol 2,3-dioxygenase-like lactoylglutathione lyase family enzyme